MMLARHSARWWVWWWMLATMTQPALSVDLPLEYPGVIDWDTPSTNACGSMPLGNGDIGINAWAQSDGALNLYLGKTDAWSGLGRLLKVGRIRLRFTPNRFSPGQPFRQSLLLNEGKMLIQAGPSNKPLRLELWVDAHQPAVHLEAQSSEPFELEADLELWRTNQHQLAGAERQSAFGLQNAPFPLVEEPDIIWTGRSNAVVWYHRNETSIWQKVMTLQGFDRITSQMTDPLLHRTFGGLFCGSGLVRTQPSTLRSSRSSNRFALTVILLTRIAPTIDDWIKHVQRLAEEVESKPLLQARQDHQGWWRDYWRRSWIRVGIPEENRQRMLSLPYLSGSASLVQIGGEGLGRKGFVGDLQRIVVSGEALSELVLAEHARSGSYSNHACLMNWEFGTSHEGSYHNPERKGPRAKPLGDVQAVQLLRQGGIRLRGWGWLESQPLAEDCPRDGLTIEAWICPRGSQGLIVEKSLPGGLEDFSLQLDQGLLAQVGTNKLRIPYVFATNRWTPVAMTYSRIEGLRLFADGRLLCGQSPSRLVVDPDAINRGYLLQRYLNALAGRGADPIKFNGSIFTIDDLGHNADYREWGGLYWFQNTRLTYWPMLASGDLELMLPLFQMYLHALPVAQARSQIWQGLPGAWFPEAMWFWGVHPADVYGWNRSDKPAGFMQSGPITRHFTGNLELLALALDYYDFSRNTGFARTYLMPLASQILEWWMAQFPPDHQGQVHLRGLNALETYRNVLDPTPDTAGLQWVFERLLALPGELVSDQLRQKWAWYSTRLPPIAIAGKGLDRRLKVGSEVPGPVCNTENPELYAVFPFRLFTVGTPDLDVGINTFWHRVFTGNRGWRQDDIQAAWLGLADTAASYAAGRLQTYNLSYRFPVFWGPNDNWVPDQDHGGVGLTALQSMLLQYHGNQILLFPAWLRCWDVDFRLHAPQRTVIEGRYRGGKWLRLDVDPPQRAKDLVVLPAQ